MNLTPLTVFFDRLLDRLLATRRYYGATNFLPWTSTLDFRGKDMRHASPSKSTIQLVSPEHRTVTRKTANISLQPTVNPLHGPPLAELRR